MATEHERNSEKHKKEEGVRFSATASTTGHLRCPTEWRCGRCWSEKRCRSKECKLELERELLQTRRVPPIRGKCRFESRFEYTDRVDDRRSGMIKEPHLIQGLPRSAYLLAIEAPNRLIKQCRSQTIVIQEATEAARVFPRGRDLN